MEKHLEPKSLSFEYGGKEITLETGRIARQATAAVLVTVDQTQVCLLYTSDAADE